MTVWYPLPQGEWASGKPHGQGTATHKDGEKYVGTYKAGLYHGEGERASHFRSCCSPRYLAFLLGITLETRNVLMLLLVLLRCDVLS